VGGRSNSLQAWTEKEKDRDKRWLWVYGIKGIHESISSRTRTRFRSKKAWYMIFANQKQRGLEA
jgi:hypothetical protein